MDGYHPVVRYFHIGCVQFYQYAGLPKREQLQIPVQAASYACHRVWGDLWGTLIEGQIFLQAGNHNDLDRRNSAGDNTDLRIQCEPCRALDQDPWCWTNLPNLGFCQDRFNDIPGENADTKAHHAS